MHEQTRKKGRTAKDPRHAPQGKWWEGWPMDAVAVADNFCHTSKQLRRGNRGVRIWQCIAFSQETWNFRDADNPEDAMDKESFLAPKQDDVARGDVDEVAALDHERIPWPDRG
jgi:hypothetical protein